MELDILNLPSSHHSSSKCRQSDHVSMAPGTETNGPLSGVIINYSKISKAKLGKEDFFPLCLFEFHFL